MIVEEEDSGGQEFQVVQLIFCSIVVLINAPVVLSSTLLLYRENVEPFTSYIFLWNVCLADSIQGLVYVVASSYVLAKKTCSRDLIFCVALGSTICSFSSVLLIAAERYLYLVVSIRYNSIVTRGRVKFALLVTWLISFLIGFTPKIDWGKPPEELTCWFHMCFPLILLNFFLGLSTLIIVAVLVLYILIYVSAVNSARIRGICLCKTKRRSLIMVYISASYMIITWSPLIISMYLGIFSCALDEHKCPTLALAIRGPLLLFGLSYSLVNPLLYAWFHRPFKNALVAVLCPISRRRNSSPSYSTSVTRNLSSASQTCPQHLSHPTVT